MTNPSPSIFNNLFRFLLLLLLAAATPTATAQMSSAYSNSQDMGMGYPNFNPAMAIVILVVVCAFFFIGFLSLYFRYFASDAGGSVNPLLSAAAARLRSSKRGLDPEVIDSFPIFRYSEVKDLNIGKGGELECAVCLTEFENDDTLRLLPKCDHVFHPYCIDAWLTSHRTCPVCRADLTPSQPELVEGTESTHLDESAGLGETQNQVQISVVVDEIPKREVWVGEMPRRSRRGGGKFPRSHTTGHSLIQPGENLEKYTLRLPMELRKQMTSQRLKRTSSCLVVLPTEGSSRRGEGSSRGKRVGRSDRFEWSDRVDRSDRFQRSDRWVFSMTPPFISRARLVTSPEVAAEGEATAVGRSKELLTSVKTPFDSLAVKFDGVEQTSTRPPV